MKSYFVYALILLLFISSCTQKNPSAQQNITKDEGYKGELIVDADAGLEPIIKQEKEIFEYTYDSVKLDIAYKSEAEILSDFRSKKVPVVVLSRKLDEQEKESLKNKDTIYVTEISVAYDAVALIGNKQFDDGSLDVETLKKYFDPNNSSPTSSQMVFANQNSSTVIYVLGFLGYKEKVSHHVYGVQSIEDVVDYVEKNKNAIGFIPYNFLSSQDDERVKKSMERIKILSLRSKDENGKEIRVSANQSDIADTLYPLRRPINTITRFSYDDTNGRLLVNFLYKGKGARIFLKAGLVPARMPEREIDVNTEGLKGAN